MVIFMHSEPLLGICLHRSILVALLDSPREIIPIIDMGKNPHGGIFENIKISIGKNLSLFKEKKECKGVYF